MFRFLLPVLPWLYAILIGVAILSVIIHVVWGRRVPFLRGLMASVLLFAAGLAALDFAGPRFLDKGVYFNSYEFFHYYLGAKYPEEVGYTRLYGAAVVAGQELKHKPVPTSIRNLDTGRTISGKEVISRANEYKQRFAPERWEQFKKDLHYLWKFFGNKNGWNKMLHDKGYNPPPFYTAVGGPLTEIVTTDPPLIQWLPLIDVAWVLLAMLSVWWAYGHRVALLLFIFLATHYLANQHPPLHASFLRLDWLSALIISMSLLRKAHPAAAGVFTAYAAMMRIFPAVFVAGAAGLVIWRGLGRWRGKNSDVATPFRFLVAFTIACVCFFLYSVVYTGIDAWFEFAEKILKHNDDLSPWRIGLKYFFLWAHDNSPIALQPNMLYFRIMQGTMLLLWFLLLPPLQDDEAFAYSFVPVFILTSSTYYYWVIIGLPFLFFARRIESPLRAAAVIALYAMSLTGYWLYFNFDRSYKTFFYISAMVFAVCVVMMISAMINWVTQRARAAEASAAESATIPMETELR